MDDVKQVVCMECSRPIESDDYMIMTESGPFGLYEPKEIGALHNECYEACYGDDEDEDEDWEE